MNASDVTLGDFVQQLLVRLEDRELFFKHEKPWHEFFYRLKIEPENPGKPLFLNELFFDWNGEYPKCQELSEYLHALHWTGCMTAANPGYDKFKLNNAVGKLWEKPIESELQQFIGRTAQAARNDLAA
jgi:hypothetical protein